MATVAELTESFQAVNVTLSKSVLKQCVELCRTYNYDAEDFTDQWWAFSASTLGGEPPTLETLDQLERKELQKQNRMATPRPKGSPPKAQTSAAAAAGDVTPKRPPQTTVPKDNVEPMVIDKSNTPSHRYTQRSDSLSVQCQFGAIDGNCFKSKREAAFNVAVLNQMGNSAKYMYDKPGSRRQSINNINQWIGSEICQQHKLELTQESLKDYSGEMVVCGRICSDNPKLSLQSVSLESTIEINKGNIVRLNANGVNKFSLFNGEVVVVKGNNQKSGFIAKDIYMAGPAASPPLSLAEPLQIVVAAGPFTLPDNLSYDPLRDLIRYIVEYKPDVVILIGPFLEATHAELKEMNESYEDFFDSLVESIVGSIENDVRLVVVPSHRDAHGHVVFPTPPYEQAAAAAANVTFAPGPCMLDIDGLIVGASATDVLFHISKQELFCDKNPEGPADRMARLAGHVLGQRSFYPLYPSDPDIVVDQELLEMHGMMDATPHVLLLPSNLRYFAKRVQDCLVVNPERLTKGHVAGTFARIEVRAGDGPVCDRISCEILRV